MSLHGPALAPPLPHAPRRLREGPGERAPKPGTPDPGTPLPEGETQERSAREPVLVCAACRAPITECRACIEVNGAHTHTFLNPAGMVFRIRCFSSAPGALPAGEESDYWTWFPGYCWQACLCRVCFEHLGWRFSGAGQPFFALIHEQVVEQGPPEPLS